ncbi:MAG: hypothetical protein M3O22_00260 [Pseudomonadota bacterium]|nr:hypothetical protein [Pseudomonadota bacterium]
MPTDIALALHSLVPRARYRGSLTANRREAYDAIIWLPEENRPKPSWPQILDAALALAKTNKKTECHDYALEKCALGFSFDNKRFNVGEGKVANILALRYVADNQSLIWEPVPIITTAGEFYTVSEIEDMVAFSEAALAFRRGVNSSDVTHQNAIDALEVRDHDDQIDVAATIEAVESYDFTTGWPA